MIKFKKILSEIYFEEFLFEDDYKKEHTNLGPEINSDDNIFIPRRTKEEKDKKLLFRTYRKIRDYIKNGSQGDLDLRNSTIEFLPKNLTQVNGDLRLIDSVNLKSLPNNLTVNGRVDLEGCKNITSLPSGLKVTVYLDISQTNIKSLPLDLEVGTNLLCIKTPLEKLPDNFTVNGKLDLEKCKNITSLPSGLKVLGTLDLRDTNITELPPDLEVGGHIYLQRTPIEKLPENLTVNKDLNLEDCENIVSLPKGLKIKEDLDLTNTNINELPPDLKVGDRIILWGTPLIKNYTEDQIMDMIPNFNGQLLLW